MFFVVRAFALRLGHDRGMPKHVLTKKEQAQGLRKALSSRRTPSWLKPSMRRFLKKLEGQAQKEVGG
jgi:hypothetical protein